MKTFRHLLVCIVRQNQFYDELAKTDRTLRFFLFIMLPVIAWLVDLVLTILGFESGSTCVFYSAILVMIIWRTIGLWC